MEADMAEPTLPPGFFKGRGRYWYRLNEAGVKDGDAYEWKQCEGCGELRLIRRSPKSSWGRFCSRACAGTVRVGAGTSNWRGDDACYASIHQRVYRTRGKASECIWGCIAERYDWANLTGDYADIWDFAPMCKRCHQRFDGAIRMMSKGRDHVRIWRPGNHRYRHIGPPR
jgi:hypothetical protein